MENKVEEVKQEQNLEPLIKEVQIMREAMVDFKKKLDNSAAVAEPKTTINNKEIKEVKQVDFYKEASEVMKQDRFEFQNKLWFKNVQADYHFDKQDSNPINPSHWEELATLSVFNSMEKDFQDKYGAKYKALEDCKYHDILMMEIQKIENFKLNYKLLTGQQLIDNPYDTYPIIKSLYSNIFINR